MTEMRNKILHLIMAGILLVSMYLVAAKGAVYINEGECRNDDISNEVFMEWAEGEPDALSQNKERKKKNGESLQKGKVRVVIDAGHGGADPGKVGVNNALEKDINLEIAKKLKLFLEADDIEVVMTREDENGLYDENASNKKVQDMKNRLRIIEEADPVLVISIHQNSYHEEYVKGAQVFYYTTGEKSKQLAQIMQEQLRCLDESNTREAKGNDSYYLLKKTAKPIVIVECGFLSNRAEAEKLITPLYQEKLAFQIHMGIMKYINTLH